VVLHTEVTKLCSNLTERVMWYKCPLLNLSTTPVVMYGVFLHLALGGGYWLSASLNRLKAGVHRLGGWTCPRSSVNTALKSNTLAHIRGKIPSSRHWTHTQGTIVTELPSSSWARRRLFVERYLYKIHSQMKTMVRVRACQSVCPPVRMFHLRNYSTEFD